MAAARLKKGKNEAVGKKARQNRYRAVNGWIFICFVEV